MIYVFLANGFEEIEALAPTDILRRAGFEVKTVGIGGSEITGAHGITVKADISAPEKSDALELIILPGGMPGTTNLQKSEIVQDMINYCAERNIRMAAICAAPLVLGEKGLLNAKKAVCFPGFEESLKGADVAEVGVVTDGLITTAKSAGHAVSFGLELVKQLKGEEAAEELRFSLMQE